MYLAYQMLNWAGLLDVLGISDGAELGLTDVLGISDGASLGFTDELGIRRC
jgi:hypothetical protein